jgi:phospholipase/lecithinase/hemolysin
MRAVVLTAVAAFLALVTQAAGIGLPGPPSATTVWVFGDSTVDTGWFETFPFSGKPAFDMFLQNASTYGIGKPTNNPGPMSVEVLAALLRATAPSPANQGGSNYATSGAKNATTNANLSDTADFPNAIPTAVQIANFIQQRGFPASNDIVLIYSGGNDIGFALRSPTIDQTAYLQGQAATLAAALAGLQLRGARQIIVANQPESFGKPAVQQARQTYNTALITELAKLGVLYTWADVNGLRLAISANVGNPGIFNILYVDNTTHTACPRPSSTSITTAWAILCSPMSPVTTPDPAIAQQTLFADDQHFASGGQRVLGQFFYCLVKATWPQLVPPLLRPPVCDLPGFPPVPVIPASP